MSETDVIANRPGQSALAYRITDQAGSMSRMLARLHSFVLPSGPNQGKQPLAQLTTRAETDPAIALLSACSEMTLRSVHAKAAPVANGIPLPIAPRASFR